MNMESERSIEAFAGRMIGHANIHVKIVRLSGGLESPLVARVEARDLRRPGPRMVFVAKRLEGDLVREADIYRGWLTGAKADFAPRFLGAQPLEDGSMMLFLEALTECPSWPWKDYAKMRRVLEGMARLHALSCAPIPDVIASWPFESMLEESALRTLAFLEEVPSHSLPYLFLQTRRAARSLILQLPLLRSELLDTRFGSTVLHGDVHSGNVGLVDGPGSERLVFLDWARARVGSPLEDVSSWLKSLGLWEPEAMRRHDTLLRAYLEQRQLDSVLNSELREAYWIAAACNGLAGALLFHLQAAFSSRPRLRTAHLRSAHGWARVIRRAAAFAG
jgi:hypothetical protein